MFEDLRLVEFTAIIMKRVSEKEVAMMKPRVTVNPNQVCAVVPETIPSDIAGPNGAPIGIPGASLQLSGGAILVNCSVQEAEYKLMTESITPEKPEVESESEIVSG
jgi:hypothetical protein